MSGYRVLSNTRIRYPPFESSLMIPKRLPPLESEQVIGETKTLEDAQELVEKQLPTFKIGNDDTWHVERRIHIEGDEGEVECNVESKVMMETREVPLAIERQRTGWYLRPNPIHRYARWLVSFAVALLLLALLFQTLEPMLVAIGILPEAVFGGVRFGLLDYPFLVVYIGPLMMVPYLLRLIANVKDLRRQREFLSNEPPKPEILFLGPVVADSELECRVSFKSTPEDWLSLKVWWQVGALPPVRESVMKHLGRDENAQPPPGLSTPLPHYWEQGLSDGGGFGEDTPLMEFDAPGGLFLRPLRMMEWGGREKVSIEGGDVVLRPPQPYWPGTYYGSLLSIHWEMIVCIERKKHGPLFWVHPLRVAHGVNECSVQEPHINDGRIEDTIRFSDDSHPMVA